MYTLTNGQRKYTFLHAGGGMQIRFGKWMTLRQARACWTALKAQGYYQLAATGAIRTRNPAAPRVGYTAR